LEKESLQPTNLEAKEGRKGDVLKN
jgi:hypothetical protein